MAFDWGALTAAGVIIMLPIFVVAILLRKYLIQGLTFGAVKG
jgi:multiple sugar transport system permease protein